MDEVELDQMTLRGAFACFPSGVIAVCAMVDGVPCGMAVSSFTSVSLDPPLVSICVANSSTTWPGLRRAPRLGLSVLGQDQDVVCRTLAQKVGDRFAGSHPVERDSGAVLLDGSSLWLDCSIESEHEAGDHVIVVLRIHRLVSRPEVDPLVFHASRFRQLRAENRISAHAS